MAVISLSTLSSIATRHGLALVSVTSPDPLVEGAQRLAEWQAAGHAADMTFMMRSPDLLSDPKRLLEGVRSIVTVGVFYDRTAKPDRPEGYGRVARYAWGRDYHKVLRRALEGLAVDVERHIGRPISYRLFSDSVPLLERALAERSSIGFIGRNTLLIVPGEGSFLFLGELLWDLEVDHDCAGRERPKGHCGSCSSCMSGCPTGALVASHSLDARKCISYLTIEKRGALTLPEREMVGEWIFGCDVCQEVCPFNIVSIKRKRAPQLEALGRTSGSGPLLNLTEILYLRNHDQFVQRFGGTAIMRARREGLVRNSAVVAANTKAFVTIPALSAAVREDESPIIRSHSLWALGTLAQLEGGRARAQVNDVRDRCLHDPSSEVREEAQRLFG